MLILQISIVKGNRFAMPLSRIALQSPAGAARGQVCLLDILEGNDDFSETTYLFIFIFGRLMISVMKQMNFSELEITFSRSWLRRQASLLKRYILLSSQFRYFDLSYYSVYALKLWFRNKFPPKLLVAIEIVNHHPPYCLRMNFLIFWAKCDE